MTRNFLLLFLFTFGCATVKPNPIKVTQPCIDYPLPTKAKLMFMAQPERIEGVDESGKTIVGMRLILDPGSMLAYIKYVEILEDIATRVKKCVAPVAP